MTCVEPRIRARVSVRGKLVAMTPIAVGGMNANRSVDIELAQDGRGRYYLPATSLCGAMRSWVQSNLRVMDEGICDVGELLFGMKEADDGFSSPLFVEDGILESNDLESEIRYGIAIDERSGSVKEGFLFSRAILPKGSVFSFEMELELLNDRNCQAKKEALRLLLEAMSQGSIRFGSCKTRGYGVLKLEALEVDLYDFLKVGMLDLWLNDVRPDDQGLRVLKSTGEGAAIVLKNDDSYFIELKFSARSDIMVKSGFEGVDADMLPLMSATNRGLVPVIPGSSLKGAIRAHASRILRTIFASSGEESENDEKGYMKIVHDLFGNNERSGRVFIDDVFCLPSKPLSSEEWFCEDVEAFKRIGDKRTHVAIDRFTGGASDGALYSTRAVRKGLSWEPLRITVNLSLFSDRPDTKTGLAELALLKLVVLDMSRGMLPLGFGTNRGLGDVEITDLQFSENFPDQLTMKEAWGEFLESGGVFKKMEGDDCDE